MKKLIFTKTYSSNIFVSLDNENLHDICIRESNKLNIGDIYLGRVVSIKEDINSAFISLESGKVGFIRCKDILNRQDKNILISQGAKIRDVKISELISEGQDILVQIAREATSNKSPMLVKEISLSNKFMAILIEPDKIFYSKKIKDAKEKKRLRDFSEANNIGKKYSIIFRRQSLNFDDETLLEAYKSLEMQMDLIASKASYSLAPKKLYGAKDFVIDIMESHVEGHIDKIYVEDKLNKKLISDYLQEFGEYYGNPEIIDEYEDLFNLFDISTYIENLFSKRVLLEKGGDIYIDKTEALTVIDVNSKGFVPENSDIEPAWYINMNALKEISRQIRIRDISGIIIIDFVNFKRSENQEKFLIVIKTLFKDSEVRVEGFTKLGLLELTRKRTTNGIIDKLFVDCLACGGTGKMASKSLIMLKIEHQIYSWKKHKSAKKIDIILKKEEIDYITKYLKDDIAVLESTFDVDINFINQ